MMTGLLMSTMGVSTGGIGRMLGAGGGSGTTLLAACVGCENPNALIVIYSM
jgi:hypothetical protein